MTTLLELRDAEKRYGEQQLLDKASAVITDGHNVGLIGRNGAGKSTLCRILLGEEELDAGEVIFHPRLRLGYLRQHDPFEPGESVLEYLERDSGQPDWQCGAVAGQFELKGPDLERPVAELSGGWQTRVKLAALLLHDPNLLVLDEPTNFLDLRTQLLLQEFLRGFQGACLVVSHDRAFLKATCDRTLELSRGELTMFSGNVDAYIEYVRERIEHDKRVNAAVLAKRKQLETFINKNRANANTASQARSKAKQLERLELIEIDSALATVSLKLPEVEGRRGVALRCEDLAIGYDDLVVADDIQVEIEHGTRTAVVGDNGQGKTTFLRAATGSLEPLDGKLRWGYGCDIGVYAQHVYTSLPEQITIHDYLLDRAAPDVGGQTVLDVAGSFLFRGDEVRKQLSVLSGGERARLCLAGLLLGGHNVLVLDEPGNHLDVETIEALAAALERYNGTVVFTSHDRYFLERMATCVIEVRDGQVANYPGSYADYLYRIEKEVADGQRGAESKQKPSPTADKKQAGKGDGRRRYELQKEAASLERQIAKHEQRRQQFEQQLPTVTSNVEARNVRNAIATVQEKIGPLEQRWLEIQVELEE